MVKNSLIRTVVALSYTVVALKQMNYLKSWLVVQNLRIAFSRVFISFEAFRLKFIKKDRQNGEYRSDVLFILTILLDKCHTKSFEGNEQSTQSNSQMNYRTV